MPLQKHPYQRGRMLGLIEHEMMPGVSHSRPFHMWTDVANLLQECRRQARTMLRPEDEGWTGNALPERQRIRRGALGVDATVELVRPCAVG